MTDRRVVVTGVGTVNASTVGGRDALAWALALGRSAIGPVRAFDVTSLTSRLAAEVDEATVSSLVDRDAARRLSRICRLTLGACLLAVGDAGVDGGLGLGTVVGTEHGDFTSSRDFAQGFLRHGPAGLSPMIFPNTVMNAMAATAAIAIGAKAPSITVNQATLAGDLAVARGTRLIVDGHADAVVAGGVDELFPEVYRRLAEMGALSPMQSRAPEGCRPFAADHNGPVLGEGATFLVLEELTMARARGARIIAEIAEVAWGNVPTAPHTARPGRVDRDSPAARLVRSCAAERVARCYGSRQRRSRGRRLGARAARPRSGRARRSAAAALARAAVRPARRAGRLARGRRRAGRRARAAVGAGARYRAGRLPYRHPGGVAVVSDHLIVIAVFNAAATIADVVERARLHGPVLVVDDGSSDDSGSPGGGGGCRGDLARWSIRQRCGAPARVRGRRAPGRGAGGDARWRRPARSRRHPTPPESRGGDAAQPRHRRTARTARRASGASRAPRRTDDDAGRAAGGAARHRLLRQLADRRGGDGHPVRLPRLPAGPPVHGDDAPRRRRAGERDPPARRRARLRHRRGPDHPVAGRRSACGGSPGAGRDRDRRLPGRRHRAPLDA